MKKILKKKDKYRIAEYSFDFKGLIKCSYNLHNSYDNVNS